MDPCQKEQAILAYNSRCQCLVAAFLQNTMPWTADQKRKRRAEQAGAAGKRYKPRKHPCIRELTLPALEATPPPPVEQNQQSNLTVQEEMERARMEMRIVVCVCKALCRQALPLSPSTRHGFNPARRCISGHITPTSCSLTKRRLNANTSWSTATEMGVGISVLWRVREKGRSYASMCLERPLCHRVRARSVVRIGPPLKTGI